MTRRQMLADRAAEQRARVPRFTPVASKRSLSKRGERGRPWCTKRWTPARENDREEWLDERARKRFDAMEAS